MKNFLKTFSMKFPRHLQKTHTNRTTTYIIYAGGVIRMYMSQGKENIFHY